MLVPRLEFHHLAPLALAVLWGGHLVTQVTAHRRRLWRGVRPVLAGGYGAPPMVPMGPMRPVLPVSPVIPVRPVMPMRGGYFAGPGPVAPMMPPGAAPGILGGPMGAGVPGPMPGVPGAGMMPPPIGPGGVPLPPPMGPPGAIRPPGPVSAGVFMDDSPFGPRYRTRTILILVGSLLGVLLLGVLAWVLLRRKGGKGEAPAGGRPRRATSNAPFSTLAHQQQHQQQEGGRHTSGRPASQTSGRKKSVTFSSLFSPRSDGPAPAFPVPPAVPPAAATAPPHPPRKGDRILPPKLAMPRDSYFDGRETRWVQPGSERLPPMPVPEGEVVVRHEYVLARGYIPVYGERFGEVEVVEGEVVTVRELMPDGWARVAVRGSRKEGVLPLICLGSRWTGGEAAA